MSITTQVDAMLAVIDRELSLPPDCCVVCGDVSAREFCSPRCRLELWRSRRGLTGSVWREIGERRDGY
jgi:hypothetical protein